MTGLLVAKLPPAVQDRWDFKTTTLQKEDTPQERGEAFCRWLEVEGAAASSARLRSLALEQQGHRAGSESSLRCGRCSKAGHSKADCTTTMANEMALTGNVLAAAGGLTETGEPNRRAGGNKDQGHISREDWARKLTSEGGCKELVARLLEQGAGCPTCKEVHWFKRKVPWGEADWASNRLESCPAFKNKTPPQRDKLLGDHGGCELCTSWSHPRKLCTFREPKNPGPGGRFI